MNETEHGAGVAVAPLPAGHDDPESFWYVAPEHRADYVRVSTAGLSLPDRVTLRDGLARHLYSEAATAWAADEIAAYIRRYGVTEREALRYLGDMSGRVRPNAETSARLHARFDVGGTEWPHDAEQRVEHMWRRNEVVNAERAAAARAAKAKANTCPMCHEHIRPGPADYGPAPATRVTKRTPVPGLPAVVVCRTCAAAIEHVHAERAANTVVAAGKSRRELAREYLDAHDPAR